MRAPLCARSDPLPRMREWLDKLGEHYQMIFDIDRTARTRARDTKI
jgi:hypothetical protein